MSDTSEPTPSAARRDDTPAQDLGATNLLMALLIAALSMALGSIVVAYFVMLARAKVWPPAGTPPLPGWLWLSTGLLVGSSGALHVALWSVRRRRQAGLRAGLILAGVFAVGFLMSQVVNWMLAYAAQMPPDLNMFAVLFYLFTGLHGLHVVGGLVPLGIVTVKALRGRYGATDHDGVRHCALYWHFVDVVWLVMFGVLLLTT